MNPTITRILYLDRDEQYRTQVRDILLRDPTTFTLTEADSTDEFEALLHANKFDLILCDVNVPGLPDLEALKKVKDFDPRVTVIILTGSQNWRLGIESIQLGAADLIIKSPASLNILPHKINIVMDGIRAKEKHHEIEMRYNDMIRRSPMGVYIIRSKPGLPGRIEYISSRCCEILGIKADEALANADVMDRCTHPEERQEFNRSRKNAAMNSQTFIWEGRFIVAGDLRWVRIESEPMFLPDGDTLWNGVVVDITWRKRMEAQILQDETIFTSFLENSPVYVFFKDRDIRALRLSSNFEQMLGMPVTQALGKTMDELFPSDLSKSMVADDLRVLNEGKRVTVVEELNGHTYETTKFPIFRDGKAEMLAGFTLDITERVQTERTLRNIEAFNQAIISQSPIGIAAFHPTGQLLFANSVWKKIWGYSEQEYQRSRDRKISELTFDEMDRYLGDNQDKVRQVYERGGTLYLPDLKIPDPLPGDAEWVSQYYYAIMDEQGQVERVVTLTEDISARKKAESELHDSEALNQAIIGQSPLGLAVFTNKGKPLSGNQAWRKIWGFSEEEYRQNLQREFKELGFDEWDEYLKDHIDQVRKIYAKGGSLYLTDLKIPNPRSGAAEWVSQYYYAILDEKGQVERVVTLTEDISARKKAEAEIIRHRAMLARVQEVAHLGSVEINLTTQKVVAGAEALRIYGWGKEDLDLADVRAVALPEYRAEINNALEKLVHMGQKFDIQYKIKRRSDGVIRDIHALAEYNPLDNVVTGSIQDITERKLIMQVLMENEEKFRTLFEKANDMIFIFDGNDRIMDVNKHTCDKLGYSREELLKLTVTDLQAPQIRGVAEKTLKYGFQKYGSKVYESSGIRKDGTVFPVEVSLSKITIASGIRYFAIVRDVSERRNSG